MAVIFMPQGIINVFAKEGTFNLALGVFQIGLSILYIPLILGSKMPWTDPALSPVLLLGAKAIAIKSWWHPNVIINLEDIQKIQLKPERLVIIPHSDREPLSFSYLGPNMQEIRTEIEKYCSEHSLETEEIGYR